MRHEDPEKRRDIEDIGNALAGKEEGFRNLAIRYGDLLGQYVGSRCADRTEAEDICQETFQKAFRALSGYDPEYAFSTWITGIAKNCLIDHHRKNRNKAGTRCLSDCLSDEGFRENMLENIVSGADTDPEKQLISAQETDLLIKSVDMLDGKYRTVAHMRFIDGCTYEEIARNLDIPVNTVKTRISRSRRLLEKILENNGRNHI